MSTPRIVLDTNCVVSALIFSRGRLSWLRHAWQAGRFVPVVGRDTVGELIRVLNYPKFKLSRAEQEILLADYLPYAETFIVHADADARPVPRDPDDAIFVTLARQAGVDALVSGDEDVLALRETAAAFVILSPAQFAPWLQDRR